MRRYTTHIHLFGLFLVAAIVRLLYLKIASDFLGFDQVVSYAADSALYRQIADHILGWHENGSYGLLRMGPGYGLILAVLRLVFGDNPIWPTLFSILMGALAPVMVYLLAFRLLNSRSVALLAGLFTGFSLTSIGLSCHILTDQPFFTLHAAALVCFVTGYRSGRVRWFVWAGLIAGFAALVRPLGQIWLPMFLLLPFVLPVALAYKSRWDLLRRAAVTGLIMLVIVAGWSTRNWVTDDIFVFGSNGVITVRSYLIAQVARENWGEDKLITDYRSQWEKEDGDRTENRSAAYFKARSRILNEFHKAPWTLTKTYLRNVYNNTMGVNAFARGEIPLLKPFIYWLQRTLQSWLGLTLIGLTLLGLLVLVLQRQYAAFWILGLTYAVFTVALGASFWQGSRLHYPAEMAWSIIICYLIVQSCRLCAGLVRRLAEFYSNRT